ncbi:MAG: PAS domain S-box protein [Bryobacteraceae bacterium]
MIWLLKPGNSAYQPADIEHAGLAAAVEQSADAVVITDRRGQIQYVNPAFAEMTGYSPEEAIGQNPRILKSGLQSAEFYREIWETVAAGRVWNGRVINRRKNGSLYTEEMRITPVRDAHGEIVSYIAIKHDITERRAAEEAQRLLAAIVEGSGDAIVASTLEGRIRTWNRGAEALYGHSAAEAIGKPFSILVPPERQHRLAQLKERILQGHCISQYEGQGLHKDGHRFHVSLTAAPIRNCDGEVAAISVILRDITERRQAEEWRDLLASIVESSADAIVSGTLDGTIVTWNRSAEALFGYDAGEIVGKDYDLLVPVDRRDEVNRALEAVRSGVVSRYDTVRLGRGGRRVDVAVTISPIRNAQGVTTGVSVTARGIGERVRAAQMLHESEKRFREVFENAPFGMSASGPDGCFMQVNAAFCRMLGYSEQELLGTAWPRLIHPDDLEPSMRAAERLLKEGGHIEMEKRYLHRSGKVVWGRMRMSMVQDAAGKPQYFVVHVEDITERKRAEEALSESEDRFRVMADSCPTMMWVTGANGGTQFMNRTYREFFGAACEQGGASQWKSLIHADDAAGYIGGFERAVREHAPFRAEVRVRRADGQWRWLGSYATPRLSQSGEYLGHVGLSSDITARRLADETLRESEERFRIMADGCPAAIYVTKADGGHQFVNRAGRRFCGEKYEEVSKGNWECLMHPDDSAQFQAHAGRAVRERGPFRAEARLRRADGQWRWVTFYAEPRFSPAGEFEGHVGLSTDITEPKRAELALEFQNTLVRAILDVSLDGILVMNDENLAVAHNKKFLDVWRIPLPPLPDPGHDGAAGGGHPQIWAAAADRVQDPAAFLRQIDELNDDPDANDHCEIRLKDGRTLEMYSAGVGKEMGRRLGRVWFFRHHRAPGIGAGTPFERREIPATGGEHPPGVLDDESKWRRAVCQSRV